MYARSVLASACLALTALLSVSAGSAVAGSNPYTQNAIFMEQGYITNDHSADEVSVINWLTARQFKIQYLNAGGFNPDGTLSPSNYTTLSQWIATSRATDPSQKCIIYLSGDLSHVNNSATWQNIANVCKMFLTTYGADGVNLDFEPFQTAGANYIGLFSTVRNTVGPNANLSLDYTSDPAVTLSPADFRTVAGYFNTINPMLYDTGATTVAAYDSVIDNALQFEWANLPLGTTITPLIPSYPVVPGNTYHDPTIENIQTCTNEIWKLAQVSRTIEISNIGVWWHYSWNGATSDADWTNYWLNRATSESAYPSGTPWPIPGKVEFENYDNGGEAVAFHDSDLVNSCGAYRNEGVDIEVCSDTGGGYDVAWCNPGEWLKFTVNVATAGTYTVGFRVSAAATSGGTLHLEDQNGKNLTGPVIVPVTGGWQTWATVNATVTLPAGQQTIKLVEDNPTYNLNYMTFTPNAPAAPTGLTATSGNAQISLTWTGSSGATSYNVYRGLATGGESTTPVATGITGTSYTDAGLANGTTYYYEVAAVNGGGTSSLSGEASATALAVGSLKGAGAAASGTANLTTDGTTDWAHWGYSGATMDHKSTGGSKIASALPSGTTQYSNNAVGFTWTDGTPTPSATNSTTGVYVTGGTFTVTAPANTTSRTLKIYVGGWHSTGTLTASLSDGSAANYTASASNLNDSYWQVYTLTYNTATNGKTLTVTWAQTGGTGNVTLQAATLK